MKRRTRTPQEAQSPSASVLTAQQAKERLVRRGISVADWARRHNVPAHSVHRVLRGAKALRGDAHRIAVLLGMKDGEIAHEY